LSVGYTGFKNTKIYMGVRNVFDKQPSFANGDSQNYAYNAGDPRGRGFWLSATYKF
jgi:iron complex outermembrane recepter protein